MDDTRLIRELARTLNSALVLIADARKEHEFSEALNERRREVYHRAKAFLDGAAYRLGGGDGWH